MATQLCTLADVQDWLSVAGVESRGDDDKSSSLNAAEQAMVTRFIERASSVVASYLCQRYNPNEYAGSSPPTNTPTYVRHCAAVVSTYYVCLRRQLMASPAFEAEYKSVIEALGLIRSGEMAIPEVIESYDTTLFVTNFHVDGNYRSAKIRKVVATSVGSAPVGPIRQNLESYPLGGFLG